MHACMHTYTYIRTYVRTYIHTYIHTCIHVYIYIYICIHTHLYTHTSPGSRFSGTSLDLGGKQFHPLKLSLGLGRTPSCPTLPARIGRAAKMSRLGFQSNSMIRSASVHGDGIRRVCCARIVGAFVQESAGLSIRNVWMSRRRPEFD